MSDHPGFIRGIGNEAGVRVLAVDATAAAEELRRRHGLFTRAGALAADGLVAAQLMSAYIKGEERVTLQIQGERPRFAMLADVAADGSVRGRFTPTEVPEFSTVDGIVLVIKHDAQRELYRGLAPIKDSDLQGALQAYLEHSQQTVGVVRLLSRTDPVTGVVELACGLLVEKLPDQDEWLFRELFDDLAQADPQLLLPEVAAGSLRGFPLELLETREVVFRCSCSRERTLDILRCTGPEELRALLEEQGGAEVTCNFCRERYEFSEPELRQLLRTPEG